MHKKHKASHSNSRSSKTVRANALGLVPMFPKLNFTALLGLFKTWKVKLGSEIGYNNTKGA